MDSHLDPYQNQKIEITDFYWYGPSHRRKVQCPEWDSIASFLELVHKYLARNFREMQNVTSNTLFYINEDLSIPQDILFYNILVTKGRRGSWLMFKLHVNDAVSMRTIDSRVEKD